MNLINTYMGDYLTTGTVSNLRPVYLNQPSLVSSKYLNPIKKKKKKKKKERKRKKKRLDWIRENYLQC